MKTHVVQLERDDDVVSARDKMLWSKAPRILVVWPRRGRVLNRELDLSLLKRQSQKLGAQLAFVTFDEDVILYAREMGIPAFDSVSQAQRNVWKTSRRDLGVVDRPSRKWTLQELTAWKNKNDNQPDPKVAVRIGSFITGVVAVLALGLFLLPGAVVTVQPAEEVQTLEMTVQSNPDVTTPTLAGVIPVSSTTVIVEGQDQILSSGVLSLSDTYAEGEVELTNLTDEPVVVAAGTIVLTISEPPVRFQTMRKATIETGDENTQTIAIQAVIPGESGNVDEETILAMEGVSGLALRVSNPAATTGGEDRNVPTPTEQDQRRVTDRLLLSLQDSARQDIERMLGDSGILMMDTLQVRETILVQQQPDPGEPGDVLTLKMQVEYGAQYIEQADLKRVAALAMDAGLQSGYEPVEGTMQIVEVYQSNSGAEISEWQVLAARMVHENWQREDVIRSLLGARPDEVAAVLENEYELDAAPEVQIQPNWWPWLPYLPLRIQLEVQ
jgi:baseplate J-like protein